VFEDIAFVCFIILHTSTLHSDVHKLFSLTHIHHPFCLLQTPHMTLRSGNSYTSLRSPPHKSLKTHKSLLPSPTVPNIYLIVMIPLYWKCVMTSFHNCIITSKKTWMVSSSLPIPSLCLLFFMQDKKELGKSIKCSEHTCRMGGWKIKK
jgi:hypothetical protein